MTSTRPFSAVLRFADVTTSKEVVEARLGIKLDRFGSQRSGTNCHAQFNLPERDDLWATITDHVHEIGPQIMTLLAEGAIGRPSLDVAVDFPVNLATRSFTIPSSVCEAAGRHQIDIEISIYPVSDD